MQKLTSAQNQEILNTLKERFEKNMKRHLGLKWEKVQIKLEANPEKLSSLYQMEKTGGEPDVVGYEKQFVFMDCSQQTPKGRRSVCYDQKALEARKAHKPKDSVTAMASKMGIELLTEDEYRELQKLGSFVC